MKGWPFPCYEMMIFWWYFLIFKKGDSAHTEFAQLRSLRVFARHVFLRLTCLHVFPTFAHDAPSRIQFIQLI